ncbi:MAG: PEP/pyruvate-binding domain-containing protein, partial [Polyangia bacterium]
MPKFVYTFGNGQTEAAGAMKELLGGKGAGLAEMNRLGIPVPPGFTITTEVCTDYYGHQRSDPRELDAQLRAAFAHVESLVGGAKFGVASD